MILFRGKWYAQFCALQFFGYPALASLVTVAGDQDSAIPSILFRTSLSLCGVAIALCSLRKLTPTQSAVLSMFTLFWLAYLSRVIYQAFVLDDPFLPMDGFEYLAYTATFSILPVLGAMRGVNTNEVETFAKSVFYLGFIATILVCVGVLASFASLKLEQVGGRLAIDKLDPISLGHVGVSICLLGLYWTRYRYKPTAPPKTMLIASILLGGVILFLSASKGPFISFFVAALMFYMLPLSIFRMSMALLILGGVGGTAYLFSDDFGEDSSLAIVSRFYVFFTGSGQQTDSTTGRLQALQSAITQFSDSPLLGDSLIENALHWYPHNAILEALMATGIVGGLLVALMLLISCVMSYRYMRERAGAEWVGLLAVQYVVASMFSGGLWGSSQMWFVVIFSIFLTARRHRLLGRDIDSLDSIAVRI